MSGSKYVQVRDFHSRSGYRRFAGVFDTSGNGAVPALSEGKRREEGEGQDPAKAHPLAYAKLGYRNLLGYLTDAGLR